MKRTLAATLILLACLTSIAFGQTALVQTTLASAVNGPALYSGTSPTIQSYVCLASVTGIAGPILPGTPVSIIYISIAKRWESSTSTRLPAASR